MIRSFSIEPHMGALPIRFGMSKLAVDKVLGKPSHMSESSALPGSMNAHYAAINLLYLKPKMLVSGIALSKGVAAMFDGVDLLSLNNPAEFLYRHDNSAVAAVGFISFRQLCISVCGVLDPVSDSLSIHIEQRGMWDGYESLFKPWKPAGM